MNTQRRPGYRLAASMLLGLSVASVPCYAQANYFEGFNNIGSVPAGEQGPGGLINQGWLFVNNSDPVGPWAWHQSGPGDPPSAEGTNHIQSNPLATDFGGTVSAWAILPAIPNLQAGDVVTFYVRAQEDPTAGQRLELRYSPSGGTNVGSGLDTTGDFTDVLLSLDPPPQDPEFWTLATAVVPGSGRLALWNRFGPTNAEVEVDAFGINQEIPGPPVPAAGETVTWELASSPFVIDSTISIPEGGTVIVEPGVQIVVQSGVTLAIQGDFIAHGTSVDPISISGDWSLVTAPVRVFGTLDLAFADVTGVLYGEAGCAILVADSNFPQGQIVTREALAFTKPKLVRIDRCTFTEGGNVYVVDGVLALRDSSFETVDGVPAWLDGYVRVLRGYLLIDNVTIDGGQLELTREQTPQTAYINNVTVMNNATDAGLDLLGSNFFLGPDNVLQNNLYALQLGGGLIPGSVVPTTGNTLNYIPASTSGHAIWPDLGLPYVVQDFVPVGSWTVLPGVTVQFTADSGFYVLGLPRLNFNGLPDNPVTLQRFDPGAQWAGFLFQSGGPNKMEYAIVEGANIGVIASDAHPSVENCVLRNNNIGSNSNTFAVTSIRKTRIFNNGVGAQGTAAPVSNGEPDLFGQTNPNWIEGNGIGVQGLNASDAIDARHNYWGSPTGPTSPDNPGGTGDPIDGLILYSPFLTAAPDFNDHPPIVRMIDPFSYAEESDTSILTWDVIEDGSVASQRVLFAPAFGHSFQVLADNLPGDQRSIEYTVPHGNPGGGPNGPALIKIEATDDAGQVGWDLSTFSLPNMDGLGTTDYFFTTPLTGPYRPGEEFEVCWDHTGTSGTVSLALVLDADGTSVGLGGTTTNCMSVLLPFVSTDSARLAIIVNLSTLAQPMFFSEPFAIRPDPRIGDAPPTVMMLSPVGGESFAGGTIVPITWDASDDEALRSFDVQASYDGGRGWHFVARDLPPEARSYDWQLPASTGVADVRVRIIARDLRFQNSSDGYDRSFVVTPGDGSITGDINGDGHVDIQDLGALLAAYGSCVGDPNYNPDADFDDSGCIDLSDLGALLANYGS